MEELQRWIQTLETEWSKPHGFLGKAREGVFDERQSAQFATMLEEIKPHPNDKTIDRRLVALVWYIPAFLQWQRQRVAEKGSNMTVFDQFTNRVQGIVEEILGVP